MLDLLSFHTVLSFYSKLLNNRHEVYKNEGQSKHTFYNITLGCKETTIEKKIY